MAPRATYRLQFRKEFDFDAAAALVPYLARLGVSHLYASPIFQAHPGSTHGYDVVDYGALNTELGGRAGFERLAAVLSAHGLKLVQDVVPNHMGVGGADNAFWLDLLEWGQEADHAGWFDVDWAADRSDIRDKVLVPLLGDQYGIVLEGGALRLVFDETEGAFAVWAHDNHKLPVCPLDYEAVLGKAHPRLVDLGDAFADLMHWRPQIMRRARELKSALAEAAQDPDVRAAIEARIAAFTGRTGDLESWSSLAALIARQNWKPAHYEVASDDINYRRFFNIATLAGIRMELPDVFDHAHGLIVELMAGGVLDGLRIDHIDGLYDPTAYLDRLREAASCPDGTPFYLVVEKILGPDEGLRGDWPVDGTTGYDVTNLLTNLFVRTASETAFTRLYTSYTGEMRPFESIIFDCKVQIIDNEMSSELHRLARAATRVARQNARTADFTLTVMQRALRLLVASFPVYRTYIDGRTPPAVQDLARLDRAVASARTIDPAIDASVFVFLRQLLSGELAADPTSGYRRSDIFRCAMKLQQYCGPVMAKGVEDTAFYRYNRFIALNEVGGSPERFGITLGQFHTANAERAARWPRAMLATSTHDTKRGEDTRARLTALSCMPEAWECQVRLWSEVLQLATAMPSRPDRNDRYALFQLMVGTWPPAFLGDTPLDPASRDDYVTRLKGVMTKSIREAKRYSTWSKPDEAYEGAMMTLIDAALTGPSAQRFLEAFRPFANDVAIRGARNSFAATVLKFTIPGMPDIYQGAEGWDLTMVDPDNRRPVDYAARAAALADAEHRLAGDRTTTLRDLWARWEDGHFKLALTRMLLAERQRDEALLAGGAYKPVAVVTADADDVCAFLRIAPAVALLVVAVRFAGTSPGRGMSLAIHADLRDRTAESLLTGRRIVLGDTLDGAVALEEFPASVWRVDLS